MKYVCDIVVKKFMFAISSPDEFLFYIYICSFSTKFILQIYIIAQAYLRCCKNERKPCWNTTCGFNLVIFVINTSFADAK